MNPTALKDPRRTACHNILHRAAGTRCVIAKACCILLFPGSAVPGSPRRVPLGDRQAKVQFFRISPGYPHDFFRHFFRCCFGEPFFAARGRSGEGVFRFGAHFGTHFGSTLGAQTPLKKTVKSVQLSSILRFWPLPISLQKRA